MSSKETSDNKMKRKKSVTHYNEIKYEEITNKIIERIKGSINVYHMDFVNNYKADKIFKKFLADANKIFLSSNAKRIRGLIPVLIAKELSYDIESNQRYGVIIELLHFCSLVHDDVIDDGDYRRGYPSLNKVFSRTHAVLIGDHFMSESINYALQSKNNTKVVKLTTEVIKELITGIMMEKELKESNPCYAFYKDMAYKKTGSLFGLSFGLPFVDSDKLALAISCGTQFGFLFQIYDDYHDRDKDEGYENIYNILSEEDVKKICKSNFDELIGKCKKIEIDPVLIGVVRYLQHYGYFSDIIIK